MLGMEITINTANPAPLEMKGVGLGRGPPPPFHMVVGQCGVLGDLLEESRTSRPHALQERLFSDRCSTWVHSPGLSVCWPLQPEHISKTSAWRQLSLRGP